MGTATGHTPLAPRPIPPRSRVRPAKVPTGLGRPAAVVHTRLPPAPPDAPTRGRFGSFRVAREVHTPNPQALIMFPADSQPLPSNLPRLVTVRGQTVVRDSDLAQIYGVSTKAFNQTIRRNAARFPGDFPFRLAAEEWAGLRSQIVTLEPAGRGAHRKYLPLVFTEHGAIMAATVLNSPRAVAMSVYVVRAFARLREELLGRANRERRLAEIERTLVGHDPALRDCTKSSNPCSCRRPRSPGGKSVSMRKADPLPPHPCPAAAPLHRLP